MQVTQWILELVDRITSPLHAATDAAEEATRVIDDTEEVVERLGETSGKAAGKLEGLGKGMFFLNQLKEGVDNIRDSFNDAIEPVSGLKPLLPKCPVSPTWRGRNWTFSPPKPVIRQKRSVPMRQTLWSFIRTCFQKITPELKKAPDALEIMSNNVMTLSKTMSNDVPGISRHVHRNEPIQGFP